MPCLTTTRFATKSLRENNNSNNKKKQNFTAKTQYFNLMAPSNNVKLQSDKILATQIYFL